MKKRLRLWKVSGELSRMISSKKTLADGEAFEAMAKADIAAAAESA